MSENNDDTLLEEDLGDDVDYDLGNEDEDALLADDYDLQSSAHRTIYLEQDVLDEDPFRREPEEPLEDVLDLGVTEGDVLDDLESELQESQETVQGEGIAHVQGSGHVDNTVLSERQEQTDVVDTSHVSQETGFVKEEELATGQVKAGVESEEEEEEPEESRGDRFKTERTTMLSLKNTNKSYGNIPDSLDNVCVEDGKQVAKRDTVWRGRRGRGSFGVAGRGGSPRPHFVPGNAFNNTGGPNFNVHPQQQQQQGFAGPHFGSPNHGPGVFVRPPNRGGGRGAVMYNHQQLQQSPHKILINPHFRGAVQPHPEARLIWDTEMPPDQTQLPPPPQGDGLVSFPPGIQPLDPAYQAASQGGSYVQQFQSPPQHEPHSTLTPRFETPSQQGGYYPQEQAYVEQHHVPIWQDNFEPPRPSNDVYAQPNSVPMVMEPATHHDPMFQHLNPPMNDLTVAHGQTTSPYGGGVQYEMVSPQQSTFHNENNFPPGAVPPQHHYHQPSPMSPPVHRLPPPMMASVWHCATEVSTDDGLQHVMATHPTTTQYHSQGMYRLPSPGSMPPGMKFRQLGPGPYHHQGGPGYGNLGGRGRGMRFPAGMQTNVHQHQMRPRRPPGQQQQQQQQPQQQQQNRMMKKRPSFEANAGLNTQFKQNRFDPAAKRKKRMPDMSNLHEVQTVDMLPPETTFEMSQQPEEEEDEETREYRKKIEQQKLEREKFLQRKEERRKLAALEKQRELQKKDIDVQAAGDASQVQFEPPQGNAIATIVNRNTVEPQPVIHHPVTRQATQQQQQKKYQQQQQIQQQQHQQQLQQQQQQQRQQQQKQQLQQQLQQQKVQTQVPQNVVNRVGAQKQFYEDIDLNPPTSAHLGEVVKPIRGGRGRGVGRGRGIGRGVVNQPQQQRQLQAQQQKQIQQRQQQQLQQRQQIQQQQQVVQKVVPSTQQEVKVMPNMKVVAQGQRIVQAPQRATAAAQPAALPQPRRLVITQGAGHQVVQQPPATRQMVQQPQKPRTVVLRGANSGGKPVQPQPSQQPAVGQRIVMQTKPVQQQGVQTRQAGGVRTVLATKPMAPQQQESGPQQITLPRTRIVAIDNLSASTTEQQLRNLCRGIGVLESIQMLPKQRRSILVFTSIPSAITFYKRHHRKMIDLSLISVSLIAQ